MEVAVVVVVSGSGECAVKCRIKDPQRSNQIRFEFEQSHVVPAGVLVAVIHAGWTSCTKLSVSQRDRETKHHCDHNGSIIVITMGAVCATLDNLLGFPDCPLPGLSPSVVTMSIKLGPLVSEALGALAGNTQWRPEEERHHAEEASASTRATLNRDLETMKRELEASVQAMVAWRMQLSPAEGIRYDRIQEAVLLTIEQVCEYETFLPLTQLRDGLHAFIWHMAQAQASVSVPKATGYRPYRPDLKKPKRSA